jgi:hypothetical protein
MKDECSYDHLVRKKISDDWPFLVERSRAAMMWYTGGDARIYAELLDEKRRCVHTLIDWGWLQH